MDSWEFDYPTGSQGATNTFDGDGGPSVGNIFSRLLYAVRFGSDQILFSDRVTSDSQILYDRSPKERVAKVAPYLTLDGRVYPAVVDGRVKWIVDGYTTSDAYPYSQMTDLGSVTQDSTTKTSNTIQALVRRRPTTSATRSRRPSMRTMAPSNCTPGMPTIRCSRHGRRSSPDSTTRSPRYPAT